ILFQHKYKPKVLLTTHKSTKILQSPVWEIVEGLRGGFGNVLEPQKQEGFMLKRRKWPMKGWHKRYFFLDKGILKYGKCCADIEKGKLHGCIDVGLSVMAIKKKAKCIDLDAEENIYHLKVNYLSVCDAYLLELHHLLQCMEILHRTYSAPSIQALQVSAGLFLVRLGWEHCCYSRFCAANESHPKPLSFLSINIFSYPQSHLLLNIELHASCILHLKQESVDESHPLVHQVSNESRASIAESLSEFFDAQEVLLSASSSENEVSVGVKLLQSAFALICLFLRIKRERPNSGPVEEGTALCQRRSRLPSPSPNNSTISLWNILRNNIGKDLSKVAMPVQLNEPLNTLQRLCEELEYSELLDRAANTRDPFERMVYVATFVVSGYASSYYRTGGKPFNPVLGETYECDRPDKGFRFVAEQVSHHPPISACHAESKDFVFWQDVRCKNKFWGKSMEIVPVGTTHVTLPEFGDHYEWNKVTSCIHNILSGQRWIEHYGEISIRNSSSDVCQCKVTFVKAKYWNSSVNEVEGTVTDQKGKVVHRLFGKWHEAVFCGDPPSATCIWRANAMPVDHEQYYGFTKFAVELNELDPSLKLLLPPTDTRLRVDQRLLEEGNPEAAEEQKQRIEQLQRERRRILEENNLTHQPNFFRKSKDDTWVSKNTYWELRRTLASPTQILLCCGDCRSTTFHPAQPPL
uniref:Oxysterol-binding protein n=1 Tax=Scophthalmus maximus TaxID=52904 RepID=A0A8D3E973_SCOMX